jgi:hypothetical protein
MRIATISLLSTSAIAQQAATISGSTGIGWTEFGVEGSKDEDGNVVQQMEPEYNPTEIYTQAEAETEQGEIEEFRKKFEGIYDANMFPYGPLHGDYRAPDADDAISDPIPLPSPFPLFNGFTSNTFRASTNGLVSLDGTTILQGSPDVLPSSTINAPFVAGFWNDFFSKRHGRVYWRLEETNTTLFSEIEGSIIEGFPEMENNLGGLRYAFFLSFWRVTSYNSAKDGPQNTFQVIVTTDGKYSFAIMNYQLLEWAKAPAEDFAVAGYDDNQGNYGVLLGSYTNQVTDLSTLSTNSNVGGRHIFRLDDAPWEVAPTVAEAEIETPMPTDEVVMENEWPENDHTLGGAIYTFKPSVPIGNGTCIVNFPQMVSWFHIFDAHIRVDSPVTATTWKICAANPTFEPGMDEKFNFIVFFEPGSKFNASDINIACDDTDEYEFAVYSFPQNAEQVNGRTNLRMRDSNWDTNSAYTLTLGAPVNNFTLDDPRIVATTLDYQNYVLTNVPDTIEEIWFQFDYTDYFGSNEVGAI